MSTYSKLQRLATALGLSVFVVSCATIGTPPLEWRQDELTHHRFEIVDEQSLESYRFGGGDTVMVTMGERDGAVAGPMMFWKIDNGRLVIYEGVDGGSEFRRLTLIERKEGEVVVRTKWGLKLVFKVYPYPSRPVNPPKPG